MRCRMQIRSWMILVLLLSVSPAHAQTSFVAFESGPVRPGAMSPDGTRLFVVNTPDNTLEIFNIGPGGLSHGASVAVGMEPVAVAARTNDEIWVVNHLSDSVSVVDASGPQPFVERTLLVGDEPRDIVVAGTGNSRVFISTAHRGQHRTHSSIAGVFSPSNPADPQLTTAEVDRADLWVFDALDPGDTIGGTPIEILTFFADTPRALATDGTTVYIAPFFSGNQTAVVNEIFVPDGFDSAGPANGAPGGVPGPSTNVFGDPAPETGVIVRFENGTWKDSLDRTWNGTFPFNQGFEVPDNDVFAVNANTLVKGTIWNSVGNTIFGMAINPASNLLYVTTTESPNHIRFEGPGGGGSTVQGHLSESRVAILDPSDGSHTSNHLNLHIDYSKLHTDPNADHAAINSQIPHSLATPLLPAIHSSGSPVYIPAFGSSKIGVFTRAQLEDPSFSSNFDPTTASANYLSTQGGGPSGVIIDEVNNRLYVPTRFNNAVEVIDLNTGTTSAIHTLHNPEPQSIVEGRPFLYDATKTSGNGESSCHSCHIFNDFDGLNWNLGNPDEHMGINNIPQPDPILEIVQPRGPFHSMKGPMQVQTLRGLLNSGGMHWRGDRVDGFFGTDPCTSPGYAEANSTNAPCSEVLSFQNFIVAFEGLLGKEGTLTPLEMQKYTEFTLQVQLPPNPVRNLDNSLKTTPSNRSEQDGEDIWFSCGPGTAECAPLDPNATDTVEDCDGCHSLDPLNGFFGTGGEESFEGEPQHMKVPHNRNMYAKIGMFFDGVQQIRTSGFLHDGSVDTLKTFHNADLFDLSNNDEMALEAFLLAFDTDLSPITGQQVTIGPSNYSVADVNDRIDLINARAAAPFESEILGGLVTECGVVVKVLEGGREKGYARLADGTYQPDDNGPAITEAALRQKADPAGEAFTLTFTATPPGSEIRMGLDRDDDSLRNGVETMTGIFVDENDTGTSPFSADTDDDGFDDGIEVAHGSDPNNALSTPETPSLPGIGLMGGLLATLILAGLGAAPLRRRQTHSTIRT